MTLPPRRTMIVLAMLVGAMTLASGVLLGLEPGPIAPLSPVSLNAVSSDADAADPLFEAVSTASSSGRWDVVAIHFSGSAWGSARALDQLHERAGLGGLGYHMVIGNGRGSPDGQIEAGFRWKHQLRGITSMTGNSTLSRQKVVDICLVGDPGRSSPTQAQMNELVNLVRKLQVRYGIASERIYLFANPATDSGVLFPVAWFRQQLLNYSTR